MAGYIGVVPTPQATQTRDRFEATAGQTSFPTSGYTPGFLDVYANGLKINSEAYTATNGSDVVFDTAREAGDVIEVVAYSTFEAGKVTPDAVSDKDNESTGYFALPSGTSAERPAPASAGYTRYNTDTGSVEFYDGTNWISTNLIPTINSVTGAIYAGAASNLTIDVTNATETVKVRFSEGGITVTDVNDVTVTSGSASIAVPAAVYGQTAGDTIAISILNQDGTPSSNAITTTVVGLPSGGSLETYGSYRSHTFTSSGNFTIPATFSLPVDMLLVAGGGGGGCASGGAGAAGGGGGAGGCIISNGISVTAGSYSVVVGGGGNGSSDNTADSGSGGDGGDSSVFGVSVTGGGGGGSRDTSGRNGGSGGGTNGGDKGLVSGSGVSGQGHRGGVGGNIPSPSVGGGGGGKGSIGTDTDYNSTDIGGDGGDGIANDFQNGINKYYAGGGGGGGGFGRGGNGGSGVGADGAGNSPTSSRSISAPNNAVANRGGGGGGSAGTGNGSNGASGVVIIRYQIS